MVIFQLRINRSKQSQTGAGGLAQGLRARLLLQWTQAQGPAPTCWQLTIFKSNFRGSRPSPRLCRYLHAQTHNLHTNVHMSQMKCVFKVKVIATTVGEGRHGASFWCAEAATWRKQWVLPGNAGFQCTKHRHPKEWPHHCAEAKRCHPCPLSQTPHLESGARFDEVLLQHVVQSRVQLLSNVLDEKGATQREAVLQVCAEILMVQRCHLKIKSSLV